MFLIRSKLLMVLNLMLKKFVKKQIIIMVLRLNLSLGTTATYRCIGLFGIVGDTEQSDNIMIKDIIIDKIYF